MDQDKDTKYLQFPLYVLRDLFTDKVRTMNRIIEAGIVKIADTQICDIERASKFLNITVLDPGRLEQDGRKIWNKAPARDPQPMVNRDLVFQFRDEDKSQYDLIRLAAYLGIRSILGKAHYGKTNQQLIIARMFGYNTHKELFAANHTELIQDLIRKYSTRHHFTKLLEALEMYWALRVYSYHVRGYWIGDNTLTYEDLVRHAEQRKASRKSQQLNDAKRQIREQVLREIKAEQTANNKP